jgi:hypothetical protein
MSVVKELWMDTLLLDSKRPVTPVDLLSSNL